MLPLPRLKSSFIVDLCRTLLLLAPLQLLCVQAMAQEPADASPPNHTNGTMETYALLSLFGDVFAKTKSDYVEATTDSDLIIKALNGMVSSLDPHSAFLTEKEFRDLSDTTKGGFGGLGMEVSSEFGAVKVISPIDDTPAHKAGLRPGDYITEIDGQSILGLSLNKAVELMRGDPGTKVEIKVIREGQEPTTKILTREFINVDPVKSSQLMGDVAYLRVSTMVDSTTATKLVQAFARLSKEAKARRTSIKGIILDLRNNPGGLLEQAVETAGLFLGEKPIVSIRGRIRNRPEHHVPTTKRSIDPDLPLVVLINSGTASAPEIVAGALKDYDRAVIMGTRSFGKGSVQTIFPFPRRGALVLTTDYYYTPNGHLIQAKGIEPHITVEPARIEPLESSKFREETLPNALLLQYKREKEAPSADSDPSSAPHPKGNSQDPSKASSSVSSREPLSKPKTKGAPVGPLKKGHEQGPLPASSIIEDPLSRDYVVQRALDLVHGLWVMGKPAKVAH